MTAVENRRVFLKGSALLPLGVASGVLSAGTPFNSNSALAASPIARVGESKLKLSLNAYSFSKQLNNFVKDRRGPKMSLMELLEFCAKHNFDAIDPTGYFFPGYPDVPTDKYINNFKRKAFQLGLDLSGTGVRNDFASSDAARRAADVRHAKEWIEVAAKLGAPVIRVFAGPEQEGHTWEETAKWMATSLRECADYGKEFGVLVGVQNHGDMLKTAEQTIKIVEMVDSDWFGVIVDTGYFMTEDPYVDIAKVAPYAVNWQVKESPFGKASSIRTDLNRLIKIARESSYRGYLPIETLSLQGRPYDPFTLVPKFLDEVRAAIEQSA